MKPDDMPDAPPMEPDATIAYEPVGYRYRHEDRESWSFAPPEDADSMEILADEGWQVERLYRREDDVVD